MGESVQKKLEYIRDAPSMQIKSKSYWNLRQVEWLMRTILTLQWEIDLLHEENRKIHEKWKQVNKMFGIEPSFLKKNDMDLSPEHFKELLGTVMKTSGYSQKEIAERLGVHTETIQGWKRKGLPKMRKPYVVKVLRDLCVKK